MKQLNAQQEQSVAAQFAKLIRRKAINMGLVRLLVACGLFATVLGLEYFAGIAITRPILILLTITLLYGLLALLFELLVGSSTLPWPTLVPGARVVLDASLLSAAIYFSGNTYLTLIMFIYISHIGNAIVTGSLAASLAAGILITLIYFLFPLLITLGLIPLQPEYFPVGSLAGRLAQISFFSLSLLALAGMLAVITKDILATRRQAETAARQLTETQTATRNKINELGRTNRFMAGREKDLAELRRQANALLSALGRPAKYVT